MGTGREQIIHWQHAKQKVKKLNLELMVFWGTPRALGHSMTDNDREALRNVLGSGRSDAPRRQRDPVLRRSVRALPRLLPVERQAGSERGQDRPRCKGACSSLAKHSQAFTKATWPAPWLARTGTRDKKPASDHLCVCRRTGLGASG